MRAQDSYTALNISATTAPFQLDGGRYGIVASATWGGGSVTLEMLAPDNTTYVVAATAITANGTALVDLPAGTYKLVVATATALFVSISRVSGE